ncbi:uncharacterized protein EI90DRAFT_3119834 [Cantharellus anzutake]|uniref:uncharacterized protein n=1 Tax=Cantharellus anzutake TaxID=1750568 RepID=UPI001905BA98|nr:uncharacterized protein EI90DRAFT_3119834 [Cantharellus anzutake]KAF8336586.1 hypothetical protein EI90DRAFT_3119834 [Cantharellus anzutake]
MSARQTHQIRENSTNGSLYKSGTSNLAIPAKRPPPALASPLAATSKSKRKSIISISSDDDGGNEIKPLAGPSAPSTRTTRAITKRAPINTMSEYRKENEELRRQLEKFKLSNQSSVHEIEQLRQRLDEVEKGLTESESKLRCKDEELDSMRDQLAGRVPSNNAALLESLRSSLQCQICLELISRPHIIPGCGHEFCGLCIRDWLTKSQAGAHECPTCRKPIRTRPFKAYILPSVLEIVKNATPSELVTPVKASADKGDQPHGTDLWAGIDFEDEESESEAGGTNSSEQDGQAASEVEILEGESDDDDDNEADEPGEAGHWTMPVPIPALFEHPQLEVQRPGLWNNLSERERILVRRGASLRMIEELELQWSEQDGITGILGEYHYHFGWKIARDWRRAPAEDLETTIQASTIYLGSR